MKKRKTFKPAIAIETKAVFFRLIITITMVITLTSAAIAQDRKGYAPVNGLKLYYEVYGTGEVPLVLIHGGGSTIESTFGHILPLLTMYGKVIVLELQAHGRTSDRDSAESFEQDADDVASLLVHLKVDKANFLGFSNGGNTAMQIGIRHPDVVNKLIIVSSFYQREGFFPGFFEGLQKATLDDMPTSLKTAYLQVAPDKNHLQIMFEKDRTRMVQFKDWTDDDIRSIKAHTLFIVGDHDVITPEHTVKMFRLLPHAKLMILPGVHGSFIGEVCSNKKDSKIPEMTVAVIEEFLKDR